MKETTLTGDEKEALEVMERLGDLCRNGDCREGCVFLKNDGWCFFSTLKYSIPLFWADMYKKRVMNDEGDEE